MTSLNANAPEPMRSPWSFMGSICLHTWVLAWVALIPAFPTGQQKSLYELEIQPYEKHIIWYKLAGKLPNIKPPAAKRDARPLRARAKFEQNIVAGPTDTGHPAQLIFAPAPEITPDKPLPLPNVVAIAPQRPPALPFTAPAIEPPAPAHTPMLPEAPKVSAAALDAKALPIDIPRPNAPRFVPPKNPKLTLGAPAVLPAAPEIASAAPNLNAPVSLPQQQRKFVPPAARRPAASAPDGAATISPAPPTLSANAAMPAEASLVIAGLDPTKSTEVPAPPGSVKSGFSGGPKPRAGGEGTPSGAMIEIPSLTVEGGAKTPQPPIMMASVSPTSPEGIAAAMRAARGAFPPGGSSVHGAVRTNGAPDPRLYGRQVYTMAMQIPNLTSYSGSWMVWFASRVADESNAAADLKPPVPLHMVSARYVHTAEEDHIEGKVRLWAVIGKDGHVSEISLIQHLDDRLDRSAQEALGKWLFQPAVRNGAPIDVDAVFEIPFTLPPKPHR